MIKTVLIQSIDMENIEKDNSFPAAYAMYIILTDSPGHEWENVFENEWKSAFYTMKRKIKVVGKSLRLIFADSDNLQRHIDFAKELVDSTNKVIEDYNQKLEMEERRKKAAELEIENKKNDIRSKLKDISL